MLCELLYSAMTERSSPYMQKLANSHVVPMNGLSRRRRPTSAASVGHPYSAGVSSTDRPRIDAKFIADPDLWDPETPHEGNWKKRPTSAPVYKRLKMMIIVYCSSFLVILFFN